MSEKLEQIQGGISEAGSELATWRGLIEHPGWPLLVKKVQEKIAGYTVGLKQPIVSLDMIPKQEFLKGEVSGLEFVLELPSSEMEQLSAEIQNLNVMEEREKDAIKAETSAPESRVESSQFSRD